MIVRVIYYNYKYIRLNFNDQIKNPPIIFPCSSVLPAHEYKTMTTELSTERTAGMGLEPVSVHVTQENWFRVHAGFNQLASTYSVLTSNPAKKSIIK